MSGHALILDCDGVLADTEKDGHLVAFNQTFDEFGYPFRWSEDEYADLLKVGGGKASGCGALSEPAPRDRAARFDDLDTLLARVHKQKSGDYQDIVNSGRTLGRPGIKRLVEEALDAGCRWRSRPPRRCPASRPSRSPFSGLARANGKAVVRKGAG